MAQRSFKPKHKTTAPGRRFNGRAHIDRLYDEDWNRYRQRFLAVNSRCYACNTKAIVVDHLVPHQGDIKLFEKTDNHIPLCEKCHNTVTSLFDYRHRTGQPVTEKIRWLNYQRSLCEHPFYRVKVLPSYR